MEVSSSQEPHGALFLVLSYLRLPELFSVQRTCRSFRDAIAGDVLLWMDLQVEPPLSRKLTDGVLLELSSRARGRLRSLSLVNCWKITHDALRRVALENPDLVKINVPGCTLLTADVVVELVKDLVENQKKTEKKNNYIEETEKKKIFQVGMNGVPGLGKEHLITLFSVFPPNEIDVDVDVCPKCDTVRLVLDCTRDSCRRNEVCRGCGFCIPRCVECGVCVDDVGEESACSHILCLNCWLLLPKCRICNRPLCSTDRLAFPLDLASSFTCDPCSDPFPPSLEFDV